MNLYCAVTSLRVPPNEITGCKTQRLVRRLLKTPLFGCEVRSDLRRPCFVTYAKPLPPRAPPNREIGAICFSPGGRRFLEMSLMIELRCQSSEA